MRDRRAQGRWPSKHPLRPVTSGPFRFISIQQYPGPPLTNPEYDHATKIVMFEFCVQVPRKHTYPQASRAGRSNLLPKNWPSASVDGGRSA
ncbi:hypothetical protein JMJ77_0008909 [Colletotrichum scovillei]|uniref:Uncharacterized protein n=1 Tax=Colletotrichum scovillei TaxID=1209932 RepID=A0A9P7QTE0_9PEZI|nr:hypothetical protein JMJ78_0001823 [Colletotrichum scovillei]KAG7041205.1 hypothetical protein JMJ77_0008909 [Colletotrichum scovillei]KAG7061237.1 hypothetical protein JMJ76_0010306 [Colletotrichum scovillei]